MAENNSSSRGNGILSVVGTGPGSSEYLTPAALQELRSCDVVIGYRTYLDLIADIVEGKEIIASSMMQEVDRVSRAFDIAGQGKHVVLVSGGDPGIYAMAGLVYEVAEARADNSEIRVVAGIAALNGCAEKLGAPLMHDFATISLSDLLTPWDVIEKRVRAAVDADFVLVIYNPRSRKRDWQLDTVLEIVSTARGPETVVGMVHAATRADERVEVTTASRFDTSSVDMQSLVIIGNSSTYIYDNKMITPRGYRDKYELA